jgi:hypothetical protein
LSQLLGRLKEEDCLITRVHGQLWQCSETLVSLKEKKKKKTRKERKGKAQNFYSNMFIA